MSSRSRLAALLIALCPIWIACAPSADVGHTHDGERTADGPRVQEVIAAHEALVAAYQAGNVAAFVDLLDPEPGLLIFHPRRFDRFDDIDEIRAGLERMFAAVGETTWFEAHPTVVVKGNVSWVTSHVVIEGADLSAEYVGRSTEIWVRKDGAWRLTHAHWSEDPES